LSFRCVQWHHQEGLSWSYELTRESMLFQSAYSLSLLQDHWLRASAWDTRRRSRQQIRSMPLWRISYLKVSRRILWHLQRTEKQAFTRLWVCPQGP
jgi:hypothetical protein